MSYNEEQQRLSEISDRMNQAFLEYIELRDELGFSGQIDFQFTHKYQLSVLKKEEITYTIKGDELVFSNVKPDIIALIPKEYQLQLTKCCLIEEDYEYLIPKVYNSSTLLYFLKGMIWGDSASFPRYLYPTFEYSFEIEFTSPEGSNAKFGGSKFIVHSENKMLIDRIVGKFNALQELPDDVKDIPQHFQNLFEF